MSGFYSSTELKRHVAGVHQAGGRQSPRKTREDRVFADLTTLGRAVRREATMRYNGKRAYVDFTIKVPSQTN